MEWISDPNVWIAFGTLTVLELVLGIDNIIFISILSGKLPADRQPRARFIGLSLALVTRVLLLFSLSWVMTLTEPAHGSDLTHLETFAVDAGDHYVVNGSKSFVTGALYNELYAVFVRFGDIPGANSMTRNEIA